MIRVMGDCWGGWLSKCFIRDTDAVLEQSASMNRGKQGSGSIRSHAENAPQGPVNRPSFFRVFHRVGGMRRSILLGSPGGQIEIDPSHSIFAHHRCSDSHVSESHCFASDDATDRTKRIMSPWIVGRLGESPSSSPASNRRRASSKNWSPRVSRSPGTVNTSS